MSQASPEPEPTLEQQYEAWQDLQYMLEKRDREYWEGATGGDE